MRLAGDATIGGAIQAAALRNRSLILYPLLQLFVVIERPDRAVKHVWHTQQGAIIELLADNRNRLTTPLTRPRRKQLVIYIQKIILIQRT